MAKIKDTDKDTEKKESTTPKAAEQKEVTKASFSSSKEDKAWFKVTMNSEPFSVPLERVEKNPHLYDKYIRVYPAD